MSKIKAKTSKTIILILLFIGLYGFCEFLGFGLRFNTSDSLPFYVFISSKVKASSQIQEVLKEGVYISFKHPLSEIKIAKQVVGIPGDEIKLGKESLVINGNFIEPILEKSCSGKILHPIKERMIPDGYIFVRATHPQSFDSRYAEFGLVSVEQIEEVLWPLF